MIFKTPRRTKRIKIKTNSKNKNKNKRRKNKENRKKINSNSNKNKNSNSNSNKKINYECYAICPIMDSNNTFNGLVLPLAHGWTIWYISLIHFFTSLYALVNQHYVLSFFGFGSLGTSVNYWRYPLRNSWRRYFDICFVQLTFYFHLYYALMMTTGNAYIFFTGSGIICYGISNYFTNKNIFFATYFHILVHMFGSIGNAVLYSGEIE